MLMCTVKNFLVDSPRNFFEMNKEEKDRKRERERESEEKGERWRDQRVEENLGGLERGRLK